MTKDINQVSIVGNLVCDPEFHEKNDKKTAFLRVATGRFMSKDDRENSDEESLRRDTTIHDVRIYVDHIVSIVKNVKKGDRVVVWGEIRHNHQGSYIILLAPHARFYKVV